MPKRSMLDLEFEVNAFSMFMLKVKPRRNKSNPREPFDVRVRIRYELPRQGSPRLAAIEINVDPGDQLERADFEQISDAVFAHLAEAEADTAAEQALNRSVATRGGERHSTGADTAAAESARKATHKRILTERRSRSLTPEYLDRVAKIVRESLRSGDSRIQQAVASEFGIPLKTARNHIAKARQTGRLEMPNGEIANAKR